MPVKKRLLVLLAIAGFGVGIAILLLRLNSQVLVYQGKTVKAWLLQLSTTDAKAHDEAEAAFKALGTNAVPELARLLRADDPRWRWWIWSHPARIPRPLRGLVFRVVKPPQTYQIRPAAARALARLGPEAAAAEPALVRALQDKVNGTYWEAGTALGRIGKLSVPDLTHALKDRDTLVRCAAAYGLGEVGPEAASAAPALMELLSQGTENERQIAAQSLKKIGARATVPPTSAPQ